MGKKLDPKDFDSNCDYPQRESMNEDIKVKNSDIKGGGKEKPGESFVFGNMVFDIAKGSKLPGKRDSVQVSPAWSRLIKIDKKYANSTDLSNPVLLGTIFLDNHEVVLLIDGHHRMAKAVEEKRPKIPAILLDFDQTMKIMSGPNKKKMMSQHDKNKSESLYEANCRSGHCYKLAYHQMMKVPGSILVHGVVVGQGKISGTKYGHAWIEYKKGSEKVAWDPFHDKEFPAKEYRLVGRVRNVKEYTRKEALKMGLETEIYGPWDKKIASATHLKDSLEEDEKPKMTNLLEEAKKKKKEKCKDCQGYGCYYCGYRGWVFAPFFGKGDGSSAAEIKTGTSRGTSGTTGGGPAFPGAGGANSPGVGGGANSGMGP